MSEPFAAREPLVVPPRPVRPPGYEFTGPQDAIVVSLGRLMRIVGGSGVGFGALLLIAAFAVRGNPLVLMIQAGLMIAIGALTWRVGGRFRRIADTAGNDIAHLIDALLGLRTIYLVQVWALAIAAVFLLAVIVWVTVMVAMR
jgi:hypothetical protein